MTTPSDPPDRRADPPHNHDHDHHTPTADNPGGRFLQQTLMSHPECYVYRVPPCSTTSQGYRAQEWNLGQPLQECGFQVERRNNDLYLLFTLEQHTKLFALTKIEGTTTETGRSSSGGSNTTTNSSIDTVLDSSRYFVTKILQSNTTNETTTTPTRTALLGFGFRDRDIAIDLLGNLQQFQRSIQREVEAKLLKKKFTAIPQLGRHEKIHISSMPGSQNSGSSRSKTTTKKHNTTATTPRTAGQGGGGGLLVKKPPPGAGVATTSADLGPIPPSHKEGHRTKIDHDHTHPNATGTGAAGTVVAAEEEEEDFGDFQDGQAIITTTTTAAAAGTTATAAVLDEDARLDREIEEVFEEFQL